VYDLQDLRKAISDPRLVYRKLCNPLVRLNTLYHRRFLDQSGVQVMEREWDNLLILDGCRLDTFDEVNSIEGRLETVISGGSSSVEFLRHNIVGRNFPDTVYVSANPFVTSLDLEDNFHATRSVWETDWSEEHKTILPENVAAETRKVHEVYPNKRLVVHFMQPHVPFIGTQGRRIEQRGILTDDNETNRVWDLLRQGSIDTATAREAYRENLEVVLPYVAELLDDLGGRSVVTADHGNAFGRLGVYGHPHETYLRELVEVPWFVAERGDRRRISTGGAGGEASTDSDPEQIAQRLSHLGYLDN